MHVSLRLSSTSPFPHIFLEQCSAPSIAMGHDLGKHRLVGIQPLPQVLSPLLPSSNSLISCHSSSFSGNSSGLGHSASCSPVSKPDQCPTTFFAYSLPFENNVTWLTNLHIASGLTISSFLDHQPSCWVDHILFALSWLLFKLIFSIAQSVLRELVLSDLDCSFSVKCFWITKMWLEVR